MSINSTLATWTGKSAYWFLHTFRGGGSSLPGKLALKLDPTILKHLAKNYDVIVITGTNGKTLTTALTVKVLREQYPDILTNPSGSNMKQGIVTTFLLAPKAHQKPLAVLEVDEANVIMVTKYITPKAFVFTNIFRDQMDRYGEIYTTYQKILDGVALAPEATIIANGDLPLFNAKQLPNPILYYGFDYQPDHDQQAPANTDGLLCPRCQHILRYHSRTYSNMGKYYCPHCGFERPQLTYKLNALTAMTPTSSDFEINGQAMHLNIGGQYNIYNALAAYAVGRFMDVTPAKIAHALSDNDEQVFGRQETFHVGEKDVTLILVKNPVGLNQVLQTISTDDRPFSFAALLNANYADGIDTSWIWDGNFEKLPALNIPAYISGGERYRDITFRLKVAGVPEDQLTIIPDLTNMTTAIQKLPTKQVYVVATYTAMLQLRKQLASQGIIDGGMA